MSKYKWLNIKDYVDNMPKLAKACWYLKILIYKKQQFGGSTYTGLFRFNLKNPLTWLMILLIYIFCVICCLWDALNEVKGFVREGTTVELDKNYETTNSN